MERIELPVTTACQLHSLLTLISQVIEPILKTWPETEVTDIEAGVTGRAVSDSPNNIRIYTPVAWYSIRHTKPTRTDRAIVLTYNHGITTTPADQLDINGLTGFSFDSYQRLLNAGAMWRYADAER